LIIEKSEVEIHKIDPPKAVFFLLETDGLIGQGSANKETLSVTEADRSVA
jgi:hypothetical protein